jgi:hypothetical protein
VDAAQVLRDFGAEQVMMLDGGGSTQLSCKGEDYVSSDRLIPQALGVIGAPKKTIPNYIQRAQAGSPGSGGAALLSSTAGIASVQADQAAASQTQTGTAAVSKTNSARPKANSQTKSQTKSQSGSGAKSQSNSGGSSAPAGAQPTGTARKASGIQQSDGAPAGGNTLQADGVQLTDVLWVPVAMTLVSAIFMTTFVRRRQAV